MSVHVPARVVGLVAIATATMFLTAPDRARACGGCFAPTETATVVTAHRMAVALSPTETTLWDQIEYAGDPEDFVWVLPIRGEALVELADNAFFEALGQATQITMEGRFSPVQTFCPDPCGWGFSADAAAPGADGGVNVFGEAVVGPYETATIGSEDPEALVTWLREHGYAVPDSILPIVAHYVEQGLNFAVLRLNPNAGVNQMQPVRVTTPGLMPVFPLRMVAAGVEGKVGLELYIFAEGRYEAQNFEMAEVDREAIAYDYDRPGFNYDALFDAAIARRGGRAWVPEYAQPERSFGPLLQSYNSFDDFGNAHGSAADYRVVLRSIASPYLTKLRTDLAASFLNEDLVLTASLGGDLSNYIAVTRELNRPAPPTCATTCDDGRRPSSSGGGGTDASGERRSRSGLCSASPGSSAGHTFPGLLAMGGAALLVYRRRR